MEAIQKRVMICICEELGPNARRALHDILVQLFDPIDGDPEVAYRQLSDMLIILEELMP